MTGWWRQNALALGALAVLVPALTVTVAWNQWSAYRESRVHDPITIQPDEQATYGMAMIGPGSAEFVDDPLAPSGTRVVEARIRVDPGHPAISCAEPVLREVEGALRQWDAASYALDRGWDVNHPSSCDTEATRPYTLEVAYIVPADASGPFAVELESSDVWPRFVRMIVDP